MRFRPFPLALALILPACGGSGSSSTPVTPSTPAPVATPTPNPYVALYGCPLKPMPDLHNECPQLTPTLGQYVSDGIDKTLHDHPEYFEVRVAQGGETYYVLDRSAYIKSVVKNIQAQGVCAVEEKEEVAVKTTNDFNEQYNIWTSSGYVRRPPGAYITTCYPAQF